MPKTIAITPSWYWPVGIARVVGVPPYPIYQLCLLRNERDLPDEPALIDSEGQLTFRQLREEVDRRSQPLALAAGESRLAVLPGELSREHVLQLLAGSRPGYACGLHLRARTRGRWIPDWGHDRRGRTGSRQRRSPPYAEMLDPTLPAVTIEGSIAPVSHSNRSLLAMAISMATFVDADHTGNGCPRPLSSWEGLMAALIQCSWQAAGDPGRQ